MIQVGMDKGNRVPNPNLHQGMTIQEVWDAVHGDRDQAGYVAYVNGHLQATWDRQLFENDAVEFYMPDAT